MSMTRAEIFAEVEMVLTEHLGTEPGKVREEAAFAADLDCDSLDTIELTMALEERFGIEISDDEAAEATTVGKAVDMIAAKLGGAA